MPTNGPSAWRLNKAEQQAVKDDLAQWEERHESLKEESPEEFDRLKEDEKKRLTRVIQEEKHQKSLAKQGAAAAKGKGRGKQALPVSGASQATAPASASGASNVNQSYFEGLKQDLKVIAEKLGDLKGEKPVPIRTGDASKGGIQD